MNLNSPKSAVISDSFGKVSMFSTELEFPNYTASAFETRNHILNFRTTLEQITATSLPPSQVKKEIILKNYSPENYQLEKIQTFSCE